MKIFFFDDVEWSLSLANYVANLNSASADLTIYFVAPDLYQTKKNIDDFFHAVLTDKAWRIIHADKEQNQNTLENNQTRSLMDLIKDATDALFLININRKATSNSKRQQQDGVELLKHIRLTEELGEARNLHVALYSFKEQLELLESKPENLMILSKGVSFHRLPECLPNWTEDNLLELAKKQAKIADREFQRFVQCDYQLPDSAHQFSNWWGINQIIEARKVLKLPDCQVSAALIEDLAKLENKKSLFLNKHSGFNNSNNIDNKYLYNLRRSIPDGSNIIYIDDEKEWKDILSNALKTDLIGTTIESHLVTSKNQLSNDWILKNVPDIKNASLILLDLRLGGNNEIDIPVNEVSGMRMAKLLRKNYPGLPIVLLTASNKAHTFEAAMKNGIDGYWMKEGLGEHVPQGSSAENYMKLLELIVKMHTPEYRFLRLFSQKITGLKDTPDHWWTKHLWCEKDITSTEKSKVFDILDGVVILFREYLRLFHLNHGFSGEHETIEKSWINAMIVEVVKVLELIHCLESAHAVARDRNKVTFSSLADTRQDVWGRQIYKNRARSAHANANDQRQPNFSNVLQVLRGVLKYLETKPSERPKHQEIDRKTFQKIEINDLWKDIEDFMN